jgi:hypothetical protein
VAEKWIRWYVLRIERHPNRTSWLRRFISFNHGQDPHQLGTTELAAYLNHLVLNRGGRSVVSPVDLG